MTLENNNIRRSLIAYRVMAWATGIWLIALCTEMVLKYIIKVDWPLDWVAIVHGWVYFVYLLVTLNLAVKVRWPLWTTVGTLLAGTIPLLGIIVEHFRTKDVKERFNLEAPAAQAEAERALDPDATSSPSPRD